MGMALEKQSVLIAIPCYSGDLSVPTVQSILHAIDALDANSIGRDVRILTGCAMVQDARDMLAGHFLASNHTDILWVDGDIQFEWRDLLSLLARPVDFVAGAYRWKKDIEDYPIGWDDGPLYAHDPVTGERSEQGLIKVNWVPMGFCRMKRSVVERVAESRSEFRYTTPAFPDMTFTGMFDREVRNGQSVGEDVTFCNRWRELGGSVFIDPWLRLTHVGKKSYSGCVGDYLRSRGKPPTPERMEETFRLIRDEFSKPEMRQLINAATGEAA